MNQIKCFKSANGSAGPRVSLSVDETLVIITSFPLRLLGGDDDARGST